MKMREVNNRSQCYKECQLGKTLVGFAVLKLFNTTCVESRKLRHSLSVSFDSFSRKNDCVSVSTHVTAKQTLPDQALIRINSKQ